MIGRRLTSRPGRTDEVLLLIEVALREAVDGDPREIETCASCGVSSPYPFGGEELFFCLACRDCGRPALASDPYDDLGGSG